MALNNLLRQKEKEHLSVDKCHDAPQGRLLLEDKRLEKLPKNKKIYMAMDRGYEDDATRQLVTDKGFEPLVPPKSNRREPWDYDKKLYKRRNEISSPERLPQSVYSL